MTDYHLEKIRIHETCLQKIGQKITSFHCDYTTIQTEGFVTVYITAVDQFAPFFSFFALDFGKTIKYYFLPQEKTTKS